jgi:serine protease Do
VEQLKDHGNVDRGWLGVQIQSLTPEMAAGIGIPNAKGAIVASVIDDGPASRAGVRQGDVIVSLNGADVDDSRDLTQKVAGLRAGQKAEFSVLRDRQRQTISVTIAKRDEQRVASVNRSAIPNRGDGGGNR